MKPIDFLPPRYRERHRQRQALAWEISIVTLFAVLIGCGVLWQITEHWQANSQLTSIREQFRSAVELQSRLEQLQNKLAEESQTAELYLYLQHPWPRTQVLHAMEGCLSDGMYLHDVQVSHEAMTAAPPLSDEELLKMTPVQRDITRLRREADRRIAVVKIAGTTSDSKLVYDFAHRLGQTPLMATVKLEAAENQIAGSDQTTFRLRGVLKPGYGQPGGPETSLAENRP